MGNSKVIKDFSSGRYSDASLSVKVHHVIIKMSGNSNFTEPNPTLAALQETLDNYIASLRNVENGSKEDTVIKNNRRATLENLLKQMADYVQQVSGGDEAIILSSGFDVHKKPVPVGILEKATGFTVKVGENKGSVIVNCEVIAHADFYEFEYTEASSALNSIWIKRTSTKRKLIIDGLTSGKQYAFRVAGAGSDPSRTWSDEITSYVL